MYFNPFTKLMMSLLLFLFIIIFLEEWITIEIRGFINRKRAKERSDKNES